MHIIACALCGDKIRGWDSIYSTTQSLIGHIQREHPDAVTLTVVFKKPEEGKIELDKTDPMDQFLSARAWMVENNYL